MVVVKSSRYNSDWPRFQRGTHIKRKLQFQEMESEASINTDSYVQKCGLVNTELNHTEPGSAESVSLPKSSHERGTAKIGVTL